MINKILKALGISLLVYAVDCYAAESIDVDSCEYFSMGGSSSQSQEDTPQPKELNDTTLNELKEKLGVNYTINIYIKKTDSQLYWLKYTTIVLVSLGSFLFGSSVVYWYMREHKS